MPIRKRTALKATFALAAGLTAIGLFTPWQDLLKSDVPESGLNPVTGEKDAGVHTKAEMTVRLKAARDLGQIYDDQLSIQYKDGAPVPAPLYEDIKGFTDDLGGQQEYQDFYRAMQGIWIGQPAGSGGIYTQKWNPDGKLATLGDSFVIFETQRLDNVTRRFFDTMRSAKGYDEALAKHPTVKALADKTGERTNLYLTMMGQQAAAPSSKPAAVKLPSEEDFRLFRAVAEAHNTHNNEPILTGAMNTLSSEFHKQNADLASACRTAAMWSNNYFYLKKQPDFKKAVQDVQKLEDRKGSGVKVLDALEASNKTARDAVNHTLRWHKVACSLAPGND